MNIKNLLTQGENTAIEFKRQEISAEGLAKEMVAFSNGLGGHILVGIDDEGKTTGIDLASKNWEDWISNISRDLINPPLSDVKTEIIAHEGHSVLLVEVSKGEEKPYQTNKNQFLIRVGSTNRVTSQVELLRLFQQSGMFHYDAIAVSNTSYRDLNLNKINAYFDQYSIDFSKEEEPQQLLKNIDVLTKDGELTIGGLLVFGLNPQRYLPNASISFAHFIGAKISDEIIDKKLIEGTLDNQIDNCLTTIKTNILKGSKIQGGKTVDTNLYYSDKVFRELIVNACLHRNYSISGSRIRVFLFDDRLEIYSPGRLPNTVTIDKMRSGVSYSINPIILKFMENLRYIDKLGRGIPLVVKETKIKGTYLKMEEIGEEFLVSLELRSNN